MRKNRKKILVWLTAALLTATLTAGCGASGFGVSATTSVTTQAAKESGTGNAAAGSGTVRSDGTDLTTVYDAADLNTTWDNGATMISMNGDSAAVTGSGAAFKDGRLTISKAGTYVFSGTLTDGQILIDAEKEAVVHIVLNGCSVSCSNSAALYATKNAKKVILTLADGTENTLQDGKTYTYANADDDEPDAALFAKNDLTLNGNGLLTIETSKKGIHTKDKLAVLGGTYSISSADDAMNGKDSVTVEGGTFDFTVTDPKTGKGITSHGNLKLYGGTMNINDCNEGLEGLTVEIYDGSYYIVAEDDGINAREKTEDTSSSGSKNSKTSGTAGTTEAAAETTAKSADAGNTVQTADTEAAEVLMMNVSEEVTGKNTAAGTSAEQQNGTGTEALAQNGAGTNTQTQNGQNDQTGQTGRTGKGGPGGQGGPGGNGGMGGPGGPNGNGGPGGQGGSGSSEMSKMQDNQKCWIKIAGGLVQVDAKGDGLDSNGELYLTGGEVYISGPTSNGDGALDFNGTGTISGGTLVAAGSSGMVQTLGDDSTQNCITVYYDTAVAANTEAKLSDADGKTLADWTPGKSFACLQLSSPELKTGESYTVTAGTDTQTVKVSAVNNTAGNAAGGRGGMQGGKGFGGGHGGMGNGGTPPDNGQMPQGNSGNSGNAGAPSDNGQAPQGNPGNGGAPSDNGQAPQGNPGNGETPPDNGQAPQGNPGNGGTPPDNGQMPQGNSANSSAETTAAAK